MTTLREQIEALPFPFHWALDRQAVLDIIDQHECYQDGLNEAAHAAADEWADHRCIPDRDALARAMEQTTHPWVTYEQWADAIIAALGKQND